MSESDQVDILIVGAGLSGATAALALAAEYRVLLVDAGPVGGGTTNVGAGVASPILARKGNPTQYAYEALDALDELCDALGVTKNNDRPLIRPAFDETQVDYYLRSSRRHPQLASWIQPEECKDRFPLVHAPLGALAISRSRVINLPDFARRTATAAEGLGCRIETGHTLVGWSSSTDGPANNTSNVRVTLASRDSERITVSCGLLILALGAGYRHFDDLRSLNLHPVKGQTLRASRPAALDTLPNITGPGYIVHDGTDVILGSTFEHGTFDTTPTAEATEAILDVVGPIVPTLADVTGPDSFAAQSGTRVTVPGTRAPMVGPVADNVWILTGLGAKGLLMAPLMASRLRHFIQDPSTIPALLLPKYST